MPWVLAVPRYQPAPCLQEKEIMKELLENGPVQGKELAGALSPKFGGGGQLPEGLELGQLRTGRGAGPPPRLGCWRC